MNGQPLVSTLIPACNAEPWIDATLESILAQTWPNVEIIVVDDGSTDATVARVAAFADRGVRLIQQPNAGASAARNRAFSMSRGDLIQFVDADDLIAPDKVERQVSLLESTDGDVVACCEWARFTDSPGTARFEPEAIWSDFDPVQWLVTSWSGGGMMHGATWLIPRAVAERAGRWDERLSLIDDFEYFTRLLLASDGVKFCRGARTYYRSGLSTSLSRASSRRAWESAWLSLQLGTSALLQREDTPHTRAACAIVFQRFAYEVFAHARDLAESAEARATALGGSDLPPSGGPLFLALSRLVGWKRAALAKKKAYEVGWRPT